MAGKRSAQDKVGEGNAEASNAEWHPQRKVHKGRNVESSEHDAASEGGSKPRWEEKSNGPDQQEEASAGGVDSLENGTMNTGKLENGSEDMLDSDDDEDSLESNVGSDLLTNVDGQVDNLLPSRPKLTGVKIVEDDDTENVGMKNVARLLRRQRYHDDDISQSAAAPRISMSRCFRCLLPGHLARDCPNPAREKPCACCAGYGHLQSQCPKSLCFRCNGFGHVLSECTLNEAKTSGRICTRCGKCECSASGCMDWFRANWGCRQDYSESDLKHVRCFVCGKQGHLCCEDTPLEPCHPTCCLCGRKGHTGILDMCPEPLPPFLQAEAHQARRLRESSSRTRVWNGGYDRGGRVHKNDDSRRYQTGSTRVDTGRDGSGYHVRNDARRHPQGGGALAQAAQPAAVGNRYGPQRYGYGPADAQPAVQNPSHSAGRLRRGFHDGPPAQQHMRTSGPAQLAVVAHPPPDVIPYGNVPMSGGYGSGGGHGQGDARTHGGGVVMMQTGPAWQLQQHDIAAQRQLQGTGPSRGAAHFEQAHPGQPRYNAPTDATYYTANANGQGTHRRWR